ncbi:hypothetical protein [Streptomyces lycii]|uniref:Lipoprotein n=1 Tax=Streptomyces lycii TaxID=2654337 RepID=A0ABQ7FCT7_9ACTN|nr:hypothetical protein [Streptomyces lycii]KAF4405083.1 hypothetical protein GCU69_32055 [Streptomyces lycii]
MTYRHLTAAAALAACTALLVTGCGGSEDKGKDDDKIAGAEQDDKKSESPSASASGSAERPEIKLPKDVTYKFTPEQTGDAAQDAALEDNKEFIRAMDAAIVAGEPRLPALEFYTEGEAAAAAQEWVQSFIDEGWTITGLVEYYDRRVSISSGTSASISYCADESKAFNKVIKTGEVQKTKPSKNSYIAYNSVLKKNKDGVWETVKMHSRRGADSCQR